MTLEEVTVHHVWNWLYERAQDAANAGLPLNDALDAVQSGYSELAADQANAEDQP